MIQGTGSDVGKSLLVAGLARAFTRRGLAVRPFKPQNMSNNAAATPDGGEIGRAQAVQAMACGIAPSVHMNPVLLKPQSDVGAQVVVQGRVLTTALAAGYQTLKPTLMAAVLDSFHHLAGAGEGAADLILVEGAGSPAETNLRAGDIANMGFARAADVPVVIAGDIDRGGVIASLVGTHAVLDPADRAMIRGFLINRFRGDMRLFDDGMAEITRRTGWPGFGILPFLAEAGHLPAEDAVVLERAGDRAAGSLHIAVPMLSRIANFDDLDPLRLTPGVRVTMVPPGRPIPGDADLVVIPGTKATIADLAFLRAQGWDIDILAHHRRGGRVLGLCGGYQVLGRRVADPDGVEGPPGTAPGLGLLAVDTVLTGPKIVRPVTGLWLDGSVPLTGYEIHMGRTTGPDCARPLVAVEAAGETAGESHPDGARSADGRVAGTYVHGLFGEDGVRAAFLAGFGRVGTLSYRAAVEAALDGIAASMETHLDLDGLLAIARRRGA
jgi:adenosylcobyric acid synthase